MSNEINREVDPSQPTIHYFGESVGFAGQPVEAVAQDAVQAFEVYSARKGGPMRAVVYDRYGAPDVLRLEELERPVPKEDEVLIKILSLIHI